jgi:hypothetical protein
MTTRTLGALRHAGSRRQARVAACWLACLTAVPAAATAAHAQIIAVKTAPIADGGQFAFLPSANLGLGGLSIALPDSTLDAFVNPAKGSRLRGTHVFGSPTFYTVSRGAGGGLTLPVGTSISSGAWFSQFAIAMQEVEHTGRDDGVLFPTVALEGDVPAPFVQDDEPSRRNQYLHATVGRRLSRLGASVAASASWWSLNALDGVELYYPGSQHVRQHGEALDLRLGLFKEWRGQSLEALVLRNRSGMNQDVAFADIFWDPSQRQIVQIARFEPNAERTETWGLHLGYTRPLADSSWRLGGIVTANRIEQPRLPNYGLPQVPADEGRAHAYDVGAGISRSGKSWTFGVDAIFEPIWSRSWDHARKATETRTGVPIAAGTTTLANRFRFTNGILRAGVGTSGVVTETVSIGFEAGGQLKAVRYRLEQFDAVQLSETASTQSWNEWTRSWGMSLRFAGADLRYRGSLTTGAGRPGFDDEGPVFTAVDALSSFRPFPAFAVTPFGDVRVTTHQISFSIAIR